MTNYILIKIPLGRIPKSNIVSRVYNLGHTGIRLFLPFIQYYCLQVFLIPKLAHKGNVQNEKFDRTKKTHLTLFLPF